MIGTALCSSAGGGNLEAVELGHEHVEDDEVGSVRLEGAHALEPVAAVATVKPSSVSAARRIVESA